MNDLNEIQSILKTEFAAFETSDSGILNFTQTVMQYLPEYYFRKRANGKENIILLLAKSSFTIANMLFKMDYYMRKFEMSERDCIRSALLLCDGFVYGAENIVPAGTHEDPNHPKLMSVFIAHEKWNDLLPAFIRQDIADCVETHSGHWANLRKPTTEMEQFVHMCVYLATRPECTVRLPISASYYQR